MMQRCEHKPFLVYELTNIKIKYSIHWPMLGDFVVRDCFHALRAFRHAPPIFGVIHLPPPHFSGHMSAPNYMYTLQKKFRQSYVSTTPIPEPIWIWIEPSKYQVKEASNSSIPCTGSQFFCKQLCPLFPVSSQILWDMIWHPPFPKMH